MQPLETNLKYEVLIFLDCLLRNAAYNNKMIFEELSW